MNDHNNKAGDLPDPKQPERSNAAERQEYCASDCGVCAEEQEAKWQQHLESTKQPRAESSPSEYNEPLHDAWRSARTWERAKEEEEIEWGDANSLEVRWALDAWPVLRELWAAQVEHIIHYTKPEGGSLSMAEAIKRASQKMEGDQLETFSKDITKWNVHNLSWWQFNELFKADPSLAREFWEYVKEEAIRDFKAGHLAARMFERTNLQRDVWKRAQFVAVYQAMVKEYQPRGAVEHSMVEMVVVNFFMWQHWLQIHLERATTEPRRESWDYKQWRERNQYQYFRQGGKSHKRHTNMQFFDGTWDAPYQPEAEAIEQAAELADRFRRAYQASVRALRDWRRYSVPVIVQNAEQVNIAAQGASQTNVQKKTKRGENSKQRERATRPAIRLATGR